MCFILLGISFHNLGPIYDYYMPSIYLATGHSCNVHLLIPPNSNCHRAKTPNTVGPTVTLSASVREKKYPFQRRRNKLTSNTSTRCLGKQRTQVRAVFWQEQNLHLAVKISSKTGQPYSDTIAFIRRRLRFDLLKTCVISIRGYRGKVNPKPADVDTLYLNLRPQAPKQSK